MACQWTTHGDPESGSRTRRRSGLDLRVFFLDPETAMNPHLNYGQAIPGRCEGRGIGLIDTRFLANRAALSGVSFAD